MEKNTAALTDELIERLALHHIAPGVRQLAAIGGEGFYRQTEQYSRIKAFSLALLVACQGPAEDVEPYGTDDVRLIQANRSSPPLDLEAPCRDLIKYCDSHPPMGESLWFVQQIRAALASHPAPQAAAEGVGKLCAWLREHSSGAYRQCADAADLIEQLSAAAPERAAIPQAGETVPNATVIKKGAERYFMSENLGHLPDGTYSLYIAPAPDAEAIPRSVVASIAAACMETGRFNLFMSKLNAALSQPSPAVKSAEPTRGAA